MPVFRSSGLLDYWITGLLDYWITGLLDCWLAGLPGCRVHPVYRIISFFENFPACSSTINK
jgi:hypothetical protein